MTKEEKYKLVHPLEGLKYPVVAESYDDTIVKEKLYTKDKVIAMFEELKTEIVKIAEEEKYHDAKWALGLNYSKKIIQQKINALKGEKS